MRTTLIGHVVRTSAAAHGYSAIIKDAEDEWNTIRIKCRASDMDILKRSAKTGELLLFRGLRILGEEGSIAATDGVRGVMTSSSSVIPYRIQKSSSILNPQRKGFSRTTLSDMLRTKKNGPIAVKCLIKGVHFPSVPDDDSLSVSTIQYLIRKSPNKVDGSSTPSWEYVPFWIAIEDAHDEQTKIWAYVSSATARALFANVAAGHLASHCGEAACCSFAPNEATRLSLRANVPDIVLSLIEALNRSGPIVAILRCVSEEMDIELLAVEPSFSV